MKHRASERGEDGHSMMEGRGREVVTVHELKVTGLIPWTETEVLPL